MGEYSYRPSQKSPDRPSQKSPVISRSKTAMNTSRKRRTASEYVKHPSEDREVVLKKGKNIGKKYYIVEISTNRKVVWIKAFHIDNPEVAIVDIPYKEALKWMGGEESWEMILGFLHRENGKFIIDINKRQLLYSRFIMSKLVLSVCLLILASAVQFRGFKHGELSEMKMKK